MYDLCTECIYYHFKTLVISAKPLKFKTQFSLLKESIKQHDHKD